MLKVVRRDESLSSSTCHNPFLASNQRKGLPCLAWLPHPQLLEADNEVFEVLCLNLLGLYRYDS